MKKQQLINPSNRFLRSAHLERDFYDPKALDSYVLTDVAIDCVRRISGGMRPDSSQRSWRIMGDYGSGKSSFALLLAHWFAGNVSKFPKKLSRSLSYSKFNTASPDLLPVLVTGAREPLAFTIKRGLLEAVEHHYPSGLGKRGREISALLKEEDISDSEILKLLKLFGDRVRADQKGNGLLLIVDELGKSLEFAAASSGESDVFLMQRLAEDASRSRRSPFFIIGILHQGFGAYASSLGLTAKQEWEKVAGRYDEIVFQHPMEQTAALIAEALNVAEENLQQTQIKELRSSMRAASELGWYGVSSNKDSLARLAPRIFPLDPSVLPLLSRVLHRFGQNQRSIFSFLFGNEAFALRSFLESGRNEPYRAADFYDYIHSNLGHHLASTFSTTHWTTIDSMVCAYATDNPLHMQVVKTVGIFNLLNSNDLKPTPEAISLCLSGRPDNPQIIEAISLLQTDKGKRVLFDRGVAGGLCLWPHISADLQKAQESAESMIGPVTSPTDFIRTHLENTNLVARRHYIQTGNLRHFPVIFCKPSDLCDPAPLVGIDADGFALTPLCLNKADVVEAVKNAQSSEFKNNNDNCLVIIPGHLQGLAPLIREVQIWDWIATHTPELNGDKYARETVSRKRVAAQQALEEAITASIGFEHSANDFALQCYWRGEQLNVSSGKGLVSEISKICDELYKSAPKVNNELINRRNISSAAAGARMRLIEGVLEHSDEPFLGMDRSKKPPEMSMYMSVLQSGGLHVEAGEAAKFNLQGKEDPLKLAPTFAFLKRRLKAQLDEPVSINVLLEELARKPFGVRGGLAPLLLSVFYAANKRNIACYENGTFLSELTGAEFLRLTKKPEIFQFQYCDVAGLRTSAFDRLTTVLDITKTSKEPELLDVVRPLCILIANLPPYSQKTTRLSSSTLAVRDALMDARDPLKLLFERLPEACECQPITSCGKDKNNANRFVGSLQQAIDELQSAYESLLSRIRGGLMSGFGYPEGKAEKLRADINTRSKVLFPYVTEKELKAFCYRLQEQNQPVDQWLNSVASVVVYKPAEKWTDQDEDRFEQQLPELTSRFLRTEGFSFNKGDRGDGESVRLCVTKPNGEEKIQVLTGVNVDKEKVSELEKKIQQLIKEHGDLALMAASKALWNSLKG